MIGLFGLRKLTGRSPLYRIPNTYLYPLFRIDQGSMR